MELLAALPPHDRLSLVAETVESPATELHEIAQWAGAADFAFDHRIASAIFAKIEQRLSNKGAGYDYHVAHLLEHVVVRIPPEFHDDLTKRWTGGPWEENRATLDKFFSTLALRRDLRRELGT
jgi:hypothetical protein